MKEKKKRGRPKSTEPHFTQKPNKKVIKGGAKGDSSFVSERDNGLFKKGVSGNPKGRPPDSDSFAGTMRTLLDAQTMSVKWTAEEVQREIEVTSNKNLYYAIAATLITRAMAGNIPAIREVMDRVEGKPVQKVETTKEPATHAEAMEALKTLAMQEGIPLEQFMEQEGLNI